MRRVDEPYSRRRRLLVVLGAVALVAAAGLAWHSFGSRVTSEEALNSLKQEALAWWSARQADRLLAPSADDREVAFEVAAGESLERIANRLKAAGLIRDAQAFELYARVEGLDRQVQAGTHFLRPNMTAAQVLQELRVAAGPSVRVTIPEGWRSEEIADEIAEAGLADRELFLTAVASGSAAAEVGPDRPEGAGWEGYLFPDTYQFEEAAGAEAVIAKMVTNFAERVTPEMEDQARGVGLSVHEVVVLASIVEREAILPEEQPRIARVFLNRLATAPYLLNADPTVQYALGYQPEQKTWWKRNLTTEDLSVQSPYNTYEVPGLTPGPIANPGLGALRAVLEPEPGAWMYFVANGVACDGSHVFAEDWDTHLANVATYRTGECGSD